MFLFMFHWCLKTFDKVPHDKLWERLQQLGAPLHLQQVVKAMYIAFTKVRINGDTHGEKMLEIGVKQGCIPCPTLSGKYIGTYLDKIDGDSLCLF